MKRVTALLLILACALCLTGCGGEDRCTIEIIIPPGSTEAFVYSQEEISPRKNTFTVKAGAGYAQTQVLLKTVEVREKNAYEPVPLTQGTPVKLRAEKGGWFKIGVAIQNPAEVPIAVSLIVEGVNIRIA
ncbi:MAG: hypothetical protein IKJ84_04155 [Oscillospiraceae bacterium]|nr:hypothetical protein [Oscillospiraceae bacterium]